MKCRDDLLTLMIFMWLNKPNSCQNYFSKELQMHSTTKHMKELIFHTGVYCKIRISGRAFSKYMLSHYAHRIEYYDQ